MPQKSGAGSLGDLPQTPQSPSNPVGALPPLTAFPHIAGLVLARGGSRGIPLKNLAPLGSKPLLCWSLGSMLEFGKFDSVWVSTDHSGIAECAQAVGAKVFNRSSEHASDSSSSINSVKEFADAHKEVDVIGLIQCTSPFLQPDFLESAYKLILQGYDSIFSVTREKKLRWKEVDMNQGESTKALNFSPQNRPRKQDWQGELVENGMFYFSRRQLIEQGVLQGGKCGYVEIPAEYSIEVDSAFDLAFAEQVLSQDYIRLFM